MFPYSTIMTYGELKEWLNDFSDMVSDKVFEKLPYTMWRHLNQSRPKDSDVFIDWDNTKAEIYFPGDPEVNTVCKDDCSFGAFFFENFLNNDDNHWALKNAALNAGVAIKASGNAVMATLADTCNTVSFALDTKVDKAEFDAKINEIKNIIDKNYNKNEEKKDMNTFKFDFGPVNSNAVRMSMYGLAVKNKNGTFVSYDAKSGDIMDVDVFNFDGSNFLYKMPVAIKDIAVGDVVIHHGAPMFVVDISKDEKGLVVVDVVAGERKEVMLAKSPFGFNFATKVVNFLGNALSGMATSENPFGNMWMLMALSDGNADMNNMLPMLMFANNGNIDPNMLMFMTMSGKGDNNVLPLMMMANSIKTPAAASTCTCNCGQHNQ